MALATPSFEESSKQIVREFLHSVVVVDDRATLGIDNKVDDATVSILETPSRKTKVVASHFTAEVVVKRDVKIQEKISERDIADLDAKLLIDTFAELGLVCAVLKPINDEDGLEEKTNHATHKSDILILDWQIGDIEENAGDIAISIIKKILKSDSKDRIRLIAIYTSNPDLGAIVARVKDVLNTESEESVVKDYNISRGSIQIVIYQKSGGTNQIAADRVVSENDLPERLIGDFTELTKGLLSNVALRSLGALRENTHRILNKFNKKLDPSYVTHRVLINPPSEAEIHPIPLIASELLDILEDCGINTLVSSDYLEKWLDQQISIGLSFEHKVGNLTHEDVLPLVKELLNQGVDNQLSYTTAKEPWNQKIKNISNKKKDKVSFLTGLLSIEAIDPQESDKDFALLTTIKSKYKSPNPLLTLGSIVVDESQGEIKKYFLCIQPLCDSVRLSDKRNFSFIPLNIPPAGNPDKFDFVVKDKGDYVQLLTDLRAYNTLMIEFDPRGNGEILAEDSDDDWFFYGEGDRKLRWIADLKFPHAQRIITQYSELLGRVGLTESDWLRRMSGK